MLFVANSPYVPWRLFDFLREQSDKVCIRNAFADARRAQLARLSAQQVAPLFDHYWDRTCALENRDVAIDPIKRGVCPH